MDLVVGFYDNQLFYCCLTVLVGFSFLCLFSVCALLRQSVVTETRAHGALDFAEIVHIMLPCTFLQGGYTSHVHVIENWDQCR